MRIVADRRPREAAGRPVAATRRLGLAPLALALALVPAISAIPLPDAPLAAHVLVARGQGGPTSASATLRPYDQCPGGGGPC